MKTPYSLSIRSSLFLVAFAMATASLFVITNSVLSEFNDKVLEAKLDSARFAYSIASEFRVLVNSASEMGETLALLPEVQRKDVGAIEPILAKLIDKSPVYANIVIMDDEGRAWASGIPLKGRSFSMADRKYFRDAMAASRYSSGEYTVGKTSGIPVLTFGYPIPSDSELPAGVIAMGLNLEYFQKTFEKILLPLDANFLLLDHKGTILFSPSSQGADVGKPYPPELFATMRSLAAEATTEGEGFEGDYRVMSYTRLSLEEGGEPYLYVRVSIPYARILEANRGKLASKLGLLVTLMALGVGAVWYIGKRYILIPVETVKDAILAVAGGAEGVRIGGKVPPGEFTPVAHAFDNLLSHWEEEAARRRAAEEEKSKLEAQLRQAQKMEAVGRLAGGVAHDFNNMLSVILGYTELAMDGLADNDPMKENLAEIKNAATRSAQITRQLLAFARKQAIVPKVLDLNVTLEPMLNMIKRLIGEDVELTWEPGEHLWKTRIDPSQVDQLLANLATNARDALKGAGCITIQTSNAVIDRDYCESHAGFTPGEFVVLRVSDNGCGIPHEELGSIFDPFFTTKEQGRGTGLGLATVYGIVKQNQGFINVYSEKGLGTTFTIYLPRVEEELSATHAEETALTGGGETILVVEDEESGLRLLKRYLEGLGYKVLTAATPAAALELVESAGHIDLIVTDVVLPGMNGRELTEKLAEKRPALRHLFMSGYTANIIAHHGILDEGVNFIQKPYTLRAMAAKVREVLNM